MAFDTNTLTLKGAELLASATAADRLVIVGCDATTTYLTEQQAQAISLRPSTPASNTTTVTQLGATAEHVMCRAYFRAGDNTGGDVNTLYLYGYRESAPNDLYVVYICSSQTAFHLPVVGDVIDEYQPEFDIVYTLTTGSVGFATQATYNTQAEFNLLKERTVTTHKEGAPTTGENQTIYGDKLFKDKILIAGSGIPADEECTIQEIRYPGDNPGEYNTWIRFEWPDGEDSHTLYVGGGGEFDEDLTVLGSVTSDSIRTVHDATIEGDASISQSLIVTGGCDFKNVVVVEGDLCLYNEMTTHNALVLSNNSGEGVADTEIVDIYGVRNIYVAGDMVLGTSTNTCVFDYSTITNGYKLDISLPSASSANNKITITDASLYSKNVISENGVVRVLDGSNNIRCDLSYSGIELSDANNQVSAAIYSATGGARFGGDIEAGGNIQLTSGEIILGTSTNIGEIGYASIVNGYNLFISLPSASSANNKITVTDASLYSKNVISENGVVRVLDGSNNIRVGLVYSGIELFDVSNNLSAAIYSANGNATFSGDLVVYGNITADSSVSVTDDLSVSGKTTLASASVTGLFGISPEPPSSGTEIKLPVGGIVLVYQTNSWSVGSVQTFTAGSVYVAEFLNDGSTGWKASSYTIPAGKYVPLMSYTYSGSGGLKAPTLVQRVE